MHFAHIYLCIKLQIKIHISLRLIVIWNCTRAYILVCIWETFWNVMHTYMYTQFAALIAFLVISHRILIVSCALIYDDAIRACAVSTVTADGTGKLVLLTYSLTASHCSTEAHLAGVPFPRSFDSRLVLRLHCSARLKSLIGCGCKKNTPVPRLNKGISCQEKGDKNCSFEQGGHGHPLALPLLHGWSKWSRHCDHTPQGLRNETDK